MTRECQHGDKIHSVHGEGHKQERVSKIRRKKESLTTRFDK